MLGKCSIEVQKKRRREREKVGKGEKSPCFYKAYRQGKAGKVKEGRGGWHDTF